MADTPEIKVRLTAEDTGVSADSFARQKKVGNGLGALDDNTYATFTLPFLLRQKPPAGQSATIQ